MSEVVSIANYARPDRQRPNTSGDVRQFTQQLNLCSICGASSHRASKCPQRVQNTEIREL